MKKEIRHVFNIDTTTGKEVETRIYNNSEHIVVPIKAAKEMVMNRIKYPAKVLEDTAPDWSGHPVTLNHPMRVSNTGEKLPLDIKAPEVLDKFKIGRIFNSRWDKDFLKADLWVDINKTESVGASNIIESLRNNETLEVSTGGLGFLIKEEGVFNSKKYEKVLVNIKPEHIAILTNEEGACSLKDGCGCGVAVNNCKCESYKKEDSTINEDYKKEDENPSDVAINDSQKVEVKISLNSENEKGDDDMSEDKKEEAVVEETTEESKATEPEAAVEPEKPAEAEAKEEPVANASNDLGLFIDAIENTQFKETISNAVEKYNSEKKRLLDEVVAKTKFTHEEALVFNFNQLEKILDSVSSKKEVKTTPDYSGNVTFVSNSNSQKPSIFSIEDMFKKEA